MRPLRWCGWCVGGQKTIAFLESPTQICPLTIQLLWGWLQQRLRVVYSRAAMLKPFSGEKILSPVEMRQKMAGFGENGGRNRRFWFRYPQKALPCAESRRLTYFASKWCTSLGCRISQEPKKIAESPCRGARNHAYSEPKPLNRFGKKILRGGRYPRLSYLHEFWWPSVKGFFGADGSNFPLSHRLSSSPLQHSRTTRASVWYSAWYVWLRRLTLTAASEWWAYSASRWATTPLCKRTRPISAVLNWCWKRPASSGKTPVFYYTRFCVGERRKNRLWEQVSLFSGMDILCPPEIRILSTTSGGRILVRFCILLLSSDTRVVFPLSKPIYYTDRLIFLPFVTYFFIFPCLLALRYQNQRMNGS